jgi:adenine deaminase
MAILSHDVLYSLIFMGCDFLPELRMTPMGLWDVKEGRSIIPARRLTDGA